MDFDEAAFVPSSDGAAQELGGFDDQGAGVSERAVEGEARGNAAVINLAVVCAGGFGFGDGGGFVPPAYAPPASTFVPSYEVRWVSWSSSLGSD